MQKWLDGLEEEFFSQGDFESGLGLPITPFMDRALPGISSKQVSKGGTPLHVWSGASYCQLMYSMQPLLKGRCREAVDSIQKFHACVDPELCVFSFRT